ncbi:MAG: HAD family hydrolase [Desulfobacteraceae bacterium]|nr:HAD family hydrolase [Desulfobacteraceae bacterium]
MSPYGDSLNYAGIYNTTRDMTKKWQPQNAARLFAQLDAIYDKYDQDALSRWQVYPDTDTVLARLSDFGFHLGVVSNIGAGATIAVLEKFFFEKYFSITISRNDVSYLKPSPEGLILAIQNLGMDPDKVLFVGDSLKDVVAAKKAAISSCFLSCGECRITGESADMATFQISSLSGLFDILTQ